MQRDCTKCQRSFTPSDLAREVSDNMEAERQALGLQGVMFSYYTCAACGQADIFVDMAMLEGESAEAFHQRRDEMENTVRQLPKEEVAVVIQEKDPPPSC